jgi:hypothetical protein
VPKVLVVGLLGSESNLTRSAFMDLIVVCKVSGRLAGRMMRVPFSATIEKPELVRSSRMSSGVIK